MFREASQARAAMPRAADAAARYARGHIVPLLRGRPGFRSYCTLVTEQGDEAYAISAFDDEPTAMDADRRVRRWIGAKLRDLMPDDPEVVAAEAVFHEVVAARRPQAQARDGQPPPFVLPGSTTASPAGPRRCTRWSASTGDHRCARLPRLLRLP
jgi:hypothetical protein